MKKTSITAAAALLGARGGRANTEAQAEARKRPKAGAGRPRTIYGICHKTADGATVVAEHENRVQATRAARAVLAQQPDITAVDVVVLESAGPVVASDGTQIAATHAPVYAVQTVTRRPRR